jgi:uncharacterized membrane protein YwaF
MSELRFLGKKNILGFDVGEQSVTKFVKQRTKRDQIEFKLLPSLLVRSRIVFIGKSAGVRNPIFDLGERWNIGMNIPSRRPPVPRFETSFVSIPSSFSRSTVLFLAGEKQ